MKFNWGKGLFLTYLTFVILILAAVLFAFTFDINLVADNYYERELNHQEEIDKANRAAVLPEKVLFLQTNSSLKISFPKIFGNNKIYGNIIFFRPDDSRKDFNISISLNDSLQQEIPLTTLKKGLWKVSVDWKVNNISYLSTKNIMVQ